MAVPESAVHYLEIVTPHPEAARDLYSATHDWRFGAVVPELGNAFVAALSGGTLCGIRAPMSDVETPVVRSYVRVSDIEAAIETVVQSGAEIALAPVEIPGRGTIAIYLHEGIQQGLWQVP